MRRLHGWICKGGYLQSIALSCLHRVLQLNHWFISSPKPPLKNSTLNPVKPKRTLIPTSLPRTEVILDLLEAEKAGLVLMGTEDAKSCITRLVSSRWW